MNAKALAIDPNRVVGGGLRRRCLHGSGRVYRTGAGGRRGPVGLSKPNVLVLYNPALFLPGTGVEPPRKGAETSAVRSALKIEKGDPPMIFFFGTEDRLLPASREIARQSALLGNRY